MRFIVSRRTIIPPDGTDGGTEAPDERRFDEPGRAEDQARRGVRHRV
jgi:hypothetical protein